MPKTDSMKNAEINDPIDSGKTHARQAAKDIKAAADDFRSAAETKAQELRETATTKASELRETATTKASELRETATTKAQEYKGLAGDKAQELRGRAEIAVSDASVKAKAAQKEGERYVRENPLRAVGMAFGAGLIFGLLMRR